MISDVLVESVIASEDFLGATIGIMGESVSRPTRACVIKAAISLLIVCGGAAVVGCSRESRGSREGEPINGGAEIMISPGEAKLVSGDGGICVVWPQPMMLETISIMRKVEAQAIIIGAELVLRIRADLPSAQRESLRDALDGWWYSLQREFPPVRDSIREVCKLQLPGKQSRVVTDIERELLSKYEDAISELWGDGAKRSLVSLKVLDGMSRAYSVLPLRCFDRHEEVLSAAGVLIGPTGVLANPRRLQDACYATLRAIGLSVSPESVKGLACSWWLRDPPAGAKEDWMWLEPLRSLSVLAAVSELVASPNDDPLRRPGDGDRWMDVLEVECLGSVAEWQTMIDLCDRMKYVLEVLVNLESFVLKHPRESRTPVIRWFVDHHRRAIAELIEIVERCRSAGGRIKLEAKEAKRLLDLYFSMHARVPVCEPLSGPSPIFGSLAELCSGSGFRTAVFEGSGGAWNVCFPTAKCARLSEGILEIQPTWGGLLRWK